MKFPQPRSKFFRPFSILETAFSFFCSPFLLFFVPPFFIRFLLLRFLLNAYEPSVFGVDLNFRYRPFRVANIKRINEFAVFALEFLAFDIQKQNNIQKINNRQSGRDLKLFLVPAPEIPAERRLI